MSGVDADGLSGPYRVPPTTGPASRVAKLSAHAAMHAVWLYRLGVLTLLVFFVFSARTCSLRWSAEDEARCVEACSLSDDTAYQVTGTHPCRCLAPNGDRYSPFDSRVVCE